MKPRDIYERVWVHVLCEQTVFASAGLAEYTGSELLSRVPRLFTREPSLSLQNNFSICIYLLLYIAKCMYFLNVIKCIFFLWIVFFGNINTYKNTWIYSPHLKIYLEYLTCNWKYRLPKSTSPGINMLFHVRWAQASRTEIYLVIPGVILAYQ